MECWIAHTKGSINCEAKLQVSKGNVLVTTSAREK